MSEGKSPPFSKGFGVEELLSLGRVQALSAAPDSTWLAVEVARLAEEGSTYRSDIWKVPLDGSPALRLTRGPFQNKAPCFRRDGSLGFLSNRPLLEDEGAKGSDDKSRFQVWLLPAEGGEATPLTDEPTGVSSFAFARQGDRMIAITSVAPDVPHEGQREHHKARQDKGPSAHHYREMPVRFWDHWLPMSHPHMIAYDDRGRGRVDLMPEARRQFQINHNWDLSADGRYLVSTSCDPLRDDRVYDQSLLWFDLETGQHKLLASAQYTMVEMPKISWDNRQVMAVKTPRFADRCMEHTLWVIDVETGLDRRIAADWDRWPLPEFWTPEGQLVVSADDEGDTPFFAIDPTSHQVQRLPSPASGGSHMGLCRMSDGRIAGLRHRFTHPPEPFVCDFAPHSTPTLVAQLSGFPEERGRAIAEVASFTTEANDGKGIQSFLLKPPGAEGASPTLLWIHGGPISQWRDGWHWRWNALLPVARGYAVACPNPRGSTGFGKDFIAGVWGNKWGEQCYDDLMTVTDALSSRPDIDASNMCAMGGSFGGYMTNWIGGHTDRFRCLISHAGLFALSTFYGVTDLPGWWNVMQQCDPFEGLEAFDKYSPHRFVNQWKTPTLLIHGEKDYRVPIGQALFQFEALQMRGIPSELLVFPDENHWILKPRNIEVWYQSVLDFLGRHLQSS